MASKVFDPRLSPFLNAPIWSAEARWPAPQLTRELFGVVMPWAGAYYTDESTRPREPEAAFAQRVRAYVTGTRFALVEEVLSGDGEEHPSARAHTGAREGLYDALEAHVAKLQTVLETAPETFICDEGAVFENDILALDERFAAFIETIGAAGRSGAEKLRRRAKERRESLERAREAFGAPEAAEARRIEEARLLAELEAGKMGPEEYRAILHGIRPGNSDSVLVPSPPAELEARRRKLAELTAKLEAKEITLDEFMEECPRSEFVILNAPSDERLLEEWFTVTGGPKVLRTLAIVLWRDVVGPRIEKELEADPPAVAMCIHRTASRLFSRVTREEEKNGQRVIPMPGDTMVRVATMNAGTLNATMVDRGIKLFGTVAAHRILRWQVFTGHQQALESNPDPRVITVEGGIEGLTHDVLGMKSKKDATKVRDIIEAEHAIELPIPGGTHGRLLNRALFPARGQRRARLELVLGTLLLPNYVHQLRKMVPALASAEARLVPVLELPPFAGGQERSYGPQATFSMLLVETLRERARELVEDGGVRLTVEELEELAEKAGLAPSTLPKVLDRWTLDGDDGPAFLARVGRDRYTLGDAHAKERSFLEEGGRREVQGAELGKRGVRNKRAKLNRLETRKPRGK